MPDLDCVTVFARDLGLARSTVEVLSGPDGVDVRARSDSPSALEATPLRIAVPTSDNLAGLADGWQEAFGAVVDRLRGAGVEVDEIDIAPLLRAAELLYGGAFVAERTAAVGDHITKHADLIGTDLDPTVAAIVQRGADATAVDYFRDLEQLETLGAEGEALLDGFSALLTPTTTWHPTLAQVAVDPVGANSRMGRFTNFANLLDMSSLAVPAGTVGGLPFGVMLTGRAFADRLWPTSPRSCQGRRSTCSWWALISTGNRSTTSSSPQAARCWPRYAPQRPTGCTPSIRNHQAGAGAGRQRRRERAGGGLAPARGRLRSIRRRAARPHGNRDCRAGRRDRRHGIPL